MKRLDESMLPEVPASFDRAMRSTLSAICEQERAEKARQEGRDEKVIPFPNAAQPRRSRVHKRRMLIALVAALVLIGSVALAAALRYNVFDMLLGGTPEGAESFMQYDLASVTVGNVEVRVREAAYDGVTLYLLTSARDLTATECLGEYWEEGGFRYLGGDEDLPEVGHMWTDNFWINGQEIGMPAMSSGLEAGSDTPGEVLYYSTYRLDQEGESGVFLDGDVRITLPILERQDAREWIDSETKTMREPDKGVLTFTMNCSAREQTKTLYPGSKAFMGEGIEAWVSRAIYSPLFTYITLEYDVSPSVLEAYVAEHGPGVTDESGNLLYAYSAMDAVGRTVCRLQLVDQDGGILSDEQSEIFIYGCDGYGDTSATFTFPAVDDPTQELYIAPVKDGVADMTRAIRAN